MVSFDRKALLTLSHSVIRGVLQLDAANVPLEPTVSARRPQVDLDALLSAYHEGSL